MQPLIISTLFAGLAALSLSALGCNDTRSYPPCPLGVSPSEYDCIPTYSPDGLVNLGPNSPGDNADVGQWRDVNTSPDATQRDGGAGGGNAVGGRDGGSGGVDPAWDPNMDRPTCDEIFACSVACEDDACIDACDENATLWTRDQATELMVCASRECADDPGDRGCLFDECSGAYEPCHYGTAATCLLGEPNNVRLANESLNDVAAQCSRACDTLGEMRICASRCVEQALPLAYRNCAVCTAPLVTCLADRCPIACADGGTPECDQCLQRSGCTPDFEACVE